MVATTPNQRDTSILHKGVRRGVRFREKYDLPTTNPHSYRLSDNKAGGRDLSINKLLTREEENSLTQSLTPMQTPYVVRTTVIPL